MLVCMSVQDWMSSRKLKSLGVPRFIATGRHDHDGSEYRFLIMERFGRDLQKLFEEAGKRFPTSTVFLLGLKLVRWDDVWFVSICRASSIPRHADFHTAPQTLPFAVEFAACRRKMRNFSFFATFISNSRFLWLFFDLPLIQQWHLVVVSLLLW